MQTEFKELVLTFKGKLLNVYSIDVSHVMLSHGDREYILRIGNKTLSDQDDITAITCEIDLISTSVKAFPQCKFDLTDDDVGMPSTKIEAVVTGSDTAMRLLDTMMLSGVRGREHGFNIPVTIKQNEVQSRQLLLTQMLLERLHRISNPVGHFIQEAHSNGMDLDGNMAVLLAKDANLLRDWAKETLDGVRYLCDITVIDVSTINPRYATNFDEPWICQYANGDNEEFASEQEAKAYQRKHRLAANLDLMTGELKPI